MNYRLNLLVFWGIFLPLPTPCILFYQVKLIRQYSSIWCYWFRDVDGWFVVTLEYKRETESTLDGG